jgi:hypothetical protein
MSATSEPREFANQRSTISQESRSGKIAAAVWSVSIVLLFATLAVAAHRQNQTARYESPRALPSLLEQTPGNIWSEQAVY